MKNMLMILGLATAARALALPKRRMQDSEAKEPLGGEQLYLLTDLVLTDASMVQDGSCQGENSEFLGITHCYKASEHDNEVKCEAWPPTGSDLTKNSSAKNVACEVWHSLGPEPNLDSKGEEMRSNEWELTGSESKVDSKGQEMVTNHATSTENEEGKVYDKKEFSCFLGVLRFGDTTLYLASDGQIRVFLGLREDQLGSDLTKNQFKAKELTPSQLYSLKTQKDVYTSNNLAILKTDFDDISSIEREVCEFFYPRSKKTTKQFRGQPRLLSTVTIPGYHVLSEKTRTASSTNHALDMSGYEDVNYVSVYVASNGFVAYHLLENTSYSTESDYTISSQSGTAEHVSSFGSSTKYVVTYVISESGTKTIHGVDIAGSSTTVSLKAITTSEELTSSVIYTACSASVACSGCVERYYLTNTDSCLSCSGSLCETCTNSSCSACVTDASLVDGTCQCDSGYYQSSGACVKLCNLCVSCDANSECTCVDYATFVAGAQGEVNNAQLKEGPSGENPLEFKSSTSGFVSITQRITGEDISSLYTLSTTVGANTYSVSARNISEVASSDLIDVEVIVIPSVSASDSVSVNFYKAGTYDSSTLSLAISETRTMLSIANLTDLINITVPYSYNSNLTYGVYVLENNEWTFDANIVLINQTDGFTIQTPHLSSFRIQEYAFKITVTSEGDCDFYFILISAVLILLAWQLEEWSKGEIPSRGDLDKTKDMSKRAKVPNSMEDMNSDNCIHNFTYYHAVLGQLRNAPVPMVDRASEIGISILCNLLFVGLLLYSQENVGEYKEEVDSREYLAYGFYSSLISFILISLSELILYFSSNNQKIKRTLRWVLVGILAVISIVGISLFSSIFCDSWSEIWYLVLFFGLGLEWIVYYTIYALIRLCIRPKTKGPIADSY